jgi:hypothetical protein
MNVAAKPLGGDIIDREQELDRLFAQGQITPERLSAETAAISAHRRPRVGLVTVRPFEFCRPSFRVSHFSVFEGGSA